MSGADSAVCRDDSRRRAAVRGSTTLTGLDYLEVDQNDRRTLKVVFIGRLPEGVAGTLTTASFAISGGRRTATSPSCGSTSARRRIRSSTTASP